MDESISDVKRCSSCGDTKALSAYNKRAASRDGHQPTCKKCEKITKAARYQRDREVILAKQRERNAHNPEANRARVNRWRADNYERDKARRDEYHAKPENRERARRRTAEWYAQNRDRALAQRAEFRDSNRDELNSQQRERYATDPRRQTQIKISGKKRRVALRGLPCESVDPMRVFERDAWRCGICNRKVNKRLKWPHPRSASLDHIVPVSQGGEHLYVNVQCAHLECNLKKNNRGGGEQLPLIG